MNMKRFCSLIMALGCVLLAALGLCSCDGNEEGSTTAGTFGIVYNGVVVELDKKADGILEKLGTPDEEAPVADCGTGPRVRYTYQDIVVYTVEKNGVEKIDEISLSNDIVATSKNIAIGSSEEDVREAYGKPTTDDKVKLTYAKNGLELIFTIKNGNVSAIKYNKRA